MLLHSSAPLCGVYPLIPGALIDDSSGDKGSWYRAPGWRAAARQKRLIPAVVDPFYMGQHERPLV
jgi:hypothetical protein